MTFTVRKMRSRRHYATFAEPNGSEFIEAEDHFFAGALDHWKIPSRLFLAEMMPQ